MDLGEMAARLSSVVSSQETTRAARAFLELPDPSRALGHMYTYLVWQRTLRVALGHLESAGVDLELLEIPRDAVLQTFPVGYKPVWDVRVKPPISARQIVDVYERHRRLLTEPVEQIVDAGIDRFVAVSGRAHEVRYPEYQHRVEFDTDLVVSDHETAANIAAVLTRRGGYALDTVRVRRLGDLQDGTVEIRREIEGHRVSVGVLIGGYHAHRGPIAERGDLISFRNRLVPAAQPADMLVMLAARVERKRRFALVNFNDAAVVLERSDSGLDWGLVCAAAAKACLGVTLAVVLERAERVLSREVVPAEVYSRLLDSPRARVRLKVARRVADETVALRDAHGFDTPDTAARRAWLATVWLGQQWRRDVPSLTNRLAVKVERRVIGAQLRRTRSGQHVRRVDRSLTRMRKRCGAFCELAPHLAEPERCLSTMGGWKGSPRTGSSLRAVAEMYAVPPAAHDCSRFRFDLATRQLA